MQKIPGKFEALKQVFGHEYFRGQQEAIIDWTLQGHNCLVLMPTGTGKSLCYQLPAVAREGVVLVISPLIALMQDQVQKARKIGIRAYAIHSAMAVDEKNKVLKKIKANECQLLYVTPERFRKEEFLEIIQKTKIQLLAVDEAHCISQWGHDFRPDYSKLGEIRKIFGNVQTMALTATATSMVQSDILNQLNIKDDCKVFSDGFERPNLSLNIHDVVGEDEKVRGIVALRHKIKGSCIVYFSLISSLIRISQQLRKLGLQHLVYHGDLASNERHSQQKRFQAEENQMILATPAFGLGVDKQDIRLLIHAEIPNSIESYYQEVGRAGRDGLESECHLFFDKDDLTTQMEFIKWSNPDLDFVKKVYYLIKDNPLRVEQESFDFLRDQMNFYNRRDYRVETAVNQLERWECLIENPEKNQKRLKFGYLPSNEPTNEYLAEFNINRQVIEARIKTQNEKLLEVLRLCQLEGECRMKYVLEYFGQASEPCGKCDGCKL